MTLRRKPIVAILTPPGRAAIATIGVAGTEAEQLVLRCFQPAEAGPLRVGKIRFGRWNGAAGEELVVCQTEADQVEIHCHGGQIASSAIVTDLLREGAQLVEWTQWLRQQHPSSVREEAYLALTKATTYRAARCLLDQYRGALIARIQQITAQLVAGNRTDAEQAIRQLRDTKHVGLHLTSPWRVVITGPPNVGKSSLMNALAGYQRAIVHPQAGTTRDVLAASIAIDGWPIELVDTAGLREATDPIEQQGTRLAVLASQQADLVLRVLDASDRTSHSPHFWKPNRDKLPPIITLGNKCDLLGHSAGPVLSVDGSVDPPFELLISATTGIGLIALMDRIAMQLVPAAPPAGDAILFTQRQVDRIDEVLRAIASESVSEAISILQALDV